MYPLLFRAAWYIGAALLKVSASDDISARRLLMLSGMFFITLGGWLDSLWTYCGLLLGLLKDLNLPLFRFRVTSKKSTTFLLASMVTFRPYWLKILQMFFLIISIFLGVSLKVARPSSLYTSKSMMLP